MSYTFPCGAKPGRHYTPRCEGCAAFLARVVADLTKATDSELGECLAAFSCTVYTGTGNTPCRRRSGLVERGRVCSPCRVFLEVEKRTAANRTARLAREKGAKR